MNNQVSPKPAPLCSKLTWFDRGFNPEIPAGKCYYRGEVQSWLSILPYFTGSSST